MYDDDTDVSAIKFVDRMPLMSDEGYDDAIAEAAWLKPHLPFDLQKTLSTNPFVFEADDHGPLVSQMAEYTGGPVQTLAGDNLELTTAVGVVVAHEHGRIVIGFESEEHDWIYLGWINPEDFKIIEIHCENQLWTH